MKKELFRLYRKIQHLKCITLMTSSERKLISTNKHFVDSKIGKRCFVLGNGPSLNLYDLQVLNNEDVFCVNEFVRFDYAQAVNPTYYLMADPKFFDMKNSDDGDKRLINKFNEFGECNPGIELFVPTAALKSIKIYGWDEKFKINYFKSGIPFEHNYKGKIDFSKIIPSTRAVVQYAILLAICMGYSEIYLLGTEQTNIFGNLRAFMNSSYASDYAFNMSVEEKTWKNKKLTSYSLSETLYGYAQIFEIYDELALYCKRNNIKLYNCAPETLIQGICKYNFEDLFTNCKLSKEEELNV